jgi:hypothetical protein
MTRDNLRRRGFPKPMECSFGKEFESVHHLFFDCIVSRQIWALVEKLFNYRVEKYLDIASRWLCNKKFLQFNFISSYCGGFGILGIVWFLIDLLGWIKIKPSTSYI